MNEEQLADILARHLDALLAGEPLPESIPDDIARLWPVAQTLTEAAPAPRPEFGSGLKEKLLESASGSNGTAGSVGSGFGGNLPFLAITGLLVLITGVALLVGAILFGITRMAVLEEISPTPQPLSTRPVPADHTRLPISTTAAVELTPTQPPTNSLSLPTPRATIVLDILPPVTVQAADIPLLPNLVPGNSTTGDDDDGGSGRNGDHNRGHGNDSDHHDEDNPGRSGRDD